MRLLKGLAIIVLAMFVHTSVCAKSVINASVSPEFPDGLHTKYLQYIAYHLDKELVITPMPFARRLKSLRHGEIDIMVGLQVEHVLNYGFEYLTPSYESLTHSIFVKKGDEDLITKPQDFAKYSFAVTRDAKYFDDYNRYKTKQNIEVSTLKQKVALLQRGRVKAFLHFKESTMPIIQKMGLSGSIVLADYQPAQPRQYFVALSLASPLYKEKDKITALIQSGIAKGDFARIRYQHYHPGAKEQLSQLKNKPDYIVNNEG